MRNLTARTLAGLLCVAMLPLLSCTSAGSSSSGEAERVAASSEDDELVVCISGMVTPEEGQQYYEGLSKYVAAKVGKRLRLIHKAEYAELNELLKSGEVDMAFSCSGPYVSGHDDFDLELLAAPVVDGKMTYQAYIIVPTDSTAAGLEDLQGKIFAFTDPNSNTGTLVPTYMLSVMGTTPEKYFNRVIYTYSHDNSIEAVASKEVDGASVDSLIWQYANETNPTYTSQTKIVMTSESYAIPPVVVRPDLPHDLKAALRDALLGAQEDAEGRELLAHMRIERFEVIDDSAYDSVRQMAAWVAARNED